MWISFGFEITAFLREFFTKISWYILVYNYQTTKPYTVSMSI
jgi:hypothetical protein